MMLQDEKQALLKKLQLATMFMIKMVQNLALIEKLVVVIIPMIEVVVKLVALRKPQQA